MSGLQASNSVLANAQVVARLWVTGKGCRYFHSDNLNDQECRSLFDDLSAAHAFPGDDTRKTVVGEVPGRKRAYYVHERVPDPNNPNRNVTNSWFLLDKSGRLTLPLVEAFAQNPVYAETQSDFVDRLQHADLRPGVVSPAFEVCVPASGNKHPSAKATRMRTSVLRVGLPIGILIALVSVIALLLKQDFSNPDPEDPPPVFPTEEVDSRWGSEELKSQLREAIVNTNANANDLDERELLDSFLNLFSFEPEELDLPEEQDADMEKQSKDSPPNPFAKFLLELPRPHEIDDSSVAGSTSQYYYDRLEQLALKLCTDRNGNELNLKSLNPAEIVKALTDRLDYESYYESWYDQSEQKQKKDPWLDQWRVDGKNKWIIKARILIKDKY